MKGVDFFLKYSLAIFTGKYIDFKWYSINKLGELQ
jgi:hypothetical protein